MELRASGSVYHHAIPQRLTWHCLRWFESVMPVQELSIEKETWYPRDPIGPLGGTTLTLTSEAIEAFPHLRVAAEAILSVLMKRETK